MRASELRDMSDEQLGITLKETANDYFRLRTQGQTEKLDAPSELRKSRRLIARIKTIQRERELAAVPASDVAAAKPETTTPSAVTAETNE